jgi:hypothetical protein
MKMYHFAGSIAGDGVFEGDKDSPESFSYYKVGTFFHYKSIS